jgi:raffinose/stachyose/melibiose transport system permease protein
LASALELPETVDLGRWANAWDVGHLGAYTLNSAIVTGV